MAQRLIKFKTRGDFLGIAARDFLYFGLIALFANPQKNYLGVHLYKVIEHSQHQVHALLLC